MKSMPKTFGKFKANLLTTYKKRWDGLLRELFVFKGFHPNITSLHSLKRCSKTNREKDYGFRPDKKVVIF